MGSQRVSEAVAEPIMVSSPANADRILESCILRWDDADGLQRDGITSEKRWFSSRAGSAKKIQTGTVVVVEAEKIR